MNGISGIIFLGLKKENFFDELKLIKELKKRGPHIEKYEDDQNISFSVSQEDSKHTLFNNNFFINLSGRIDNKEDLKVYLKLNKNISDQELILSGYQQMGEQIFKKLVGAFSFLIFDKRKMQFFAVRDHLGMKPFYYSFNNDYFIYGSEPRFIFLMSQAKRTLNKDKLVNSLLRSDHDYEKTFYEGIFRLERGKFLKSNSNKIENYRYHEFKTPDYFEYEDEEDCFADFRQIFTQIIDEQTAGLSNIGSALSGGLDSTSVTRVLADLNKKSGNKKNIFSYSFKFTELDKRYFKTTDEMNYVNDAIDLGGLNSRIIEIPQGDYVKQLLDCQKNFPSPNLQGNRYLELFMIKSLKKDNVKTLFTGFDGDVTVSYGMEFIQMLFRKLKFIEALKLNNQTRNNLNLKNNSLRILYSYVFLRLLPSKVHFFLRRAKGFDGLEHQFKYFHKDFKPEIDIFGLHQERRKNMYDIKNSHRDLLNKKDFQNAFESLDIDYSYNGIEERHPFFDRRLMEFCLKLHPRFKLKKGYSRYVLRESLKEYLPTSVKNRMPKSDLSPYFFYSAKNNINELIDNLMSSSSRLKDFLDSESLKRAQADPSKLSKEEITWIVNFNVHDQWIKQNIEI